MPKNEFESKFVKSLAKTGKVLVTGSEVITEPQALKEKVLALKGGGWICSTDKVFRWSSGDPLPASEILSAELVLPEKQVSVHIRRSSNTWKCTRIEEVEGSDMLYIDKEFLSSESDAKPSKLMYRNWWSLVQGDDGIGVWQPYLSRFTGWKEST